MPKEKIYPVVKIVYRNNTGFDPYLYPIIIRDIHEGYEFSALDRDLGDISLINGKIDLREFSKMAIEKSGKEEKKMIWIGEFKEFIKNNSDLIPDSIMDCFELI